MYFRLLGVLSCLLVGVVGPVQCFAPLAVVRPPRGRPTTTTTLETTAGSNNNNHHENGENDPDGDDDNDVDLPNFYDDFAELDTSLASFLAPSEPRSSPEEADATTVPSVLRERMQQVQRAEVQDQERVRNNWDQANWKVRGFSLDTVDARQLEAERSETPASSGNGPSTTSSSSSSPIHVTTLTAPTVVTTDDDDDWSVWVGRTDGSLILVRLGTEYVARFASKLALETSDDDDLSVSVQSKLVRDNDDDATRNNDSSQQTSSFSSGDPFEILCQRRAYDNQPVQHVVATAHMVYTVAEGSSDIQPWLIPETTTNTDDDTFGLVAQPALTGVHQAPLVGLHAVSMKPPDGEDQVKTVATEPLLLTSVSQDGILAVWDIPTGTLLFTCHLMNSDDQGGDDEGSVTITSATAAHGHWFLGRSDGRIWGYPLATLVEATANEGPCPLPAAEWMANPEQTAITALHVWGPATVRNTPTLVVLSGDASGLVQQWDMLERRSSDAAAAVLLEAWPKMARQRLSERAHLLQGHEGAITCITSTPHAVVTSSHDGTVRAFDPVTGDVTTRMDGFVEDQLANLCLVGSQDLLLTDGNGPHVTVHDFSSASEDVLNDVDLEWDDF